MKRIVLFTAIIALLLCSSCTKKAVCSLVINNKTDKYVVISGDVQQNVTIGPYGVGGITNIVVKDEYDKKYFYIGKSLYTVNYNKCSNDAVINLNYQ